MTDLLLPWLPLLFTASVFALVGSMALAGLIRAILGARGRILHLLTVAGGGVALVVLALLALGIDAGPALIPGFAGGLGAGCFWLIGALAARARPVWVDALVILASVAFFTSYAAMAEHAGEVARVFPGLTLPGPDGPP
ncbi:hypothetical protein HKCCSP123_06710 [Rhodobacterales bacterium HKCCSP123]|nr:hypothetical protein [Rhodobacterales bacterium HKCCSP123]